MPERVALIAPIYDPRTASRSFLRQLADRPPTAIAAGSLTLLPGANVLIEHNPDRPVGHIRSLFQMRWPDGLTWHTASLELDSDDWPRNQPVSVGITTLRETHLSSGHRILESGLLSEISITSTPAISGARMLPPAAPTNPGRRPVVPSAQAPRTLIRNCGQIRPMSSKRKPPGSTTRNG